MEGSLYSPKRACTYNPTYVAARLDFQNAFGTMHRKACIDLWEKRISSQEPWFLRFLPLKTCGVEVWPFLSLKKKTYLRHPMEYPKGILYRL